MTPTRVGLALAVLALVGCKDEPPEMAKISEAMPNIPLPPSAKVVSRAGSPEALKLTLVSSAKAPQIEAYYRRILSENGWRVLSDSRDREGAVVLLARQNGPPLWVRIQSTSDSMATMVELAGAVVSPEPEPKPAS